MALFFVIFEFLGDLAQNVRGNGVSFILRIDSKQPQLALYPLTVTDGYAVVTGVRLQRNCLSLC